MRERERGGLVGVGGRGSGCVRVGVASLGSGCLTGCWLGEEGAEETAGWYGWLAVEGG